MNATPVFSEDSLSREQREELDNYDRRWGNANRPTLPRLARACRVAIQKYWLPAAAIVVVAWLLISR